ncbi:MAG: 16S rRNA (guanine(527)-N(7))-methyltransferase RsmG [Bacteroidota bacterium]|nr:16S rRNA (guanine(527)-N(7))-methyltransferase RsmG [Bacteroidota bacterium]
MDVIKKYFPELTNKQEDQFLQLTELYKEWNSRINIISRKDIHRLYIRHILHSLSIAKIIHFKKGTEILDVGTGGGLPGIPLAIMFPDVQFILLDSIRKKIKVVDNIIQSIDLHNVMSINDRAENIQKKFDFIISRAVAKTPILINWVNKNFKSVDNNTLKNGFLFLKGGCIEEEILGIKHIQYKISDNFNEDYFLNKRIIYIRKS